ncbi:MAG: hemerythrin family protein [Proteobacteria bacterium]|nr:hemerythrin family protein [Pseudomonadota bacterium]
MTKMEWKANFSVGDTKMDDQHKGLIVLVNQLAGENEVDVREALEKLQEYADIHFRDEEALLAEIGYPDLDKQAAEHETFRKWLDEQLETYRNGGGSDTIRARIQNYLRIWWIKHILFSDKAYASYLK